MSSIYYTLSRSLHLTTISNLPIHHSIFPLSPTTSTPNFVSTPPQTSSSPVTNSTPDPTRRPSIHPQHLNEADSTVLYFMISIASYRIHPIAKKNILKSESSGNWLSDHPATLTMSAKNIQQKLCRTAGLSKKLLESKNERTN